jgi:predicted GNAT superfamily acetyltransferase
MRDPAVSIGLSNGGSDLEGILALQRDNLRERVSPGEAASQGFVTVAHTREVLARMHAQLPSIVAHRGETLVGYALAMALEARAELPLLVPMFELFERLFFEGRPLRSFRSYVMGQVCVAASERGSGLFDALYAEHRAVYGGRFELLVTEISERNLRSQRAHARVGFVELTRYADAVDTWLVVALDLRK